MNKSVIISAYKTPGRIEENLETLKGMDVVLTVDSPDSELREILKRYGLKASVSEKRRGKWKALNDAIKLADGDYILFLDSDTLIVDLGVVDGFDGVEIVKEVEGNSPLSKLIRIDYFNMYLISLLASKIGTCLGFNGSAFWIRKDVLLRIGGFKRRINEDTDLGIRFGINGFKYGVSGRAITECPVTLKDWFVQRERWALGGAEALIENFVKIIRKPIMWFPALFIMFPALIGLLINLALPDSLLLKALYLLIIPFGLLSGKAMLIAMYLLYGYHILKNIIVALLTFSIWAIFMIILSKITNYSIDFRYLPVYYFIYSPMWMFVAIIALSKYLFYRLMGFDFTPNNWKV